MALVYKKAICGICGKSIDTNDDIICIPSIFCNPHDPLYVYNDMVTHKECFDSNRDSSKIMYYKMLVQSEYQKKKCFICNMKIDSVNDFVFIPIISSNANDVISKYNCKSFHKSCYENNEIQKIIESQDI